MAKMKAYTHSCIIQNGDMAGNTYFHDVTRFEYESGCECMYCEEPLVTTEQLVAHIYGELTE